MRFKLSYKASQGWKLNNSDPKVVLHLPKMSLRNGKWRFNTAGLKAEIRGKKASLLYPTELKVNFNTLVL